MTMTRDLLPPPSADPDELPPHNLDAERRVLGTILSRSLMGDAPGEVNAMMSKIGRHHFYGVRSHDWLEAMRRVHASGHAMTTATLASIGGMTDLSDWGNHLADAQDPSVWDSDVAALEQLAHRRWLRRKASELKELSASKTATIEDTRARLSEILEDTARASTRDQSIEVVGVDDLVQYEPDPATYLIGDNVISRQSKTVLC
ncbi:MAG: hypothetical protein ACOYLU_15515, partial [Limisphaerales bacterium]